MGMTVDELTQALQDGTVNSKNFLESFSLILKAESGKGLEKILAGFNFQMKTLGFMWDRMFKTLGDQGLTDIMLATVSGLVFLTKMLTLALTPVLNILSAIIKLTWAPLFAALNKIFDRLSKIASVYTSSPFFKIMYWSSLILAVTLLAGKFSKFFLILGKGLAIVAFFAVFALVLEDIIGYLNGADSALGFILDKMDDKEWRKDHPIADMFLKMYENSQTFFDYVFTAFDMLGNILMAYPRLVMNSVAVLTKFIDDVKSGMDFKDALREARDTFAELPSFNLISPEMEEKIRRSFNATKEALKSGAGMVDKALTPPSMLGYDPGALVRSKAEIELLVTSRGNTPIDQANAERIAKTIDPFTKQSINAAVAGGR
jgi:hypothetical protein